MGIGGLVVPQTSHNRECPGLIDPATQKMKGWVRKGPN